jgi:hypothetical protein
MREYGSTGKERLVSGCLVFKSNMMAKSLFRDPKTVYVYITRDYSSYLWSMYNYWCSPLYDRARCEGKRWANKDLHYRSPAMFHELIRSISQHRHIYSPLDHIYVNLTHNDHYQRSMARYWQYISPADTLVIANEHLFQSPELCWAKVASFLNMSVTVQTSTEHMRNFSSYLINTNNHKGSTKATRADNYTMGLYEISNYEPLWNVTRKMIDETWREDCLWISNITGYQYPACHQREESIGN